MIEITEQQIERVNLILSGVPKGAEKALTSIITRARSTARIATLKGITRVYDIKQADVRAETNIQMRTRKEGGGIVGYVSFAGAAIPLYRFNVNPKTATPRTSEHIRAGVLKGTQKNISDAFVAKMKSGHMGVFERIPGQYMDKRSGRNKHAEKIGYNGKKGTADQLYGPSTAQMAKNSVILADVEAAAMDTINKRTEHEISRILNGYK